MGVVDSPASARDAQGRCIGRMLAGVETRSPWPSVARWASSAGRLREAGSMIGSQGLGHGASSAQPSIWDERVAISIFFAKASLVPSAELSIETWFPENSVQGYSKNLGTEPKFT